MNNYDQSLADLDKQASTLDQRQQVLLFVVLASGLLRLYQEFQRTTGWGNYSTLEMCIDAAEKFALRAENTNWQFLLDAIEAATPHGDDFDAPKSTYAQDAAICADTAVRLAMNHHNASINAIEYALEPLKNVISMSDLDCIDPGTGVAATDFYNELPFRPQMKQAIEFLHELISQLVFLDTFDTPALQQLKQRAAVLLPHELD